MSRLIPGRRAQPSVRILSRNAILGLPMVNSPSDEFIDRLKRSYNTMLENISTSSGDVWSWINSLRRPIHDALISGDRVFVRNMLIDPVTTDLFYGVDNLSLALEPNPIENSIVDQTESDRCRANIILLAHALGALRWVPPGTEHYDWYSQQPFAELEAPDTDSILDLIEGIVGFPIDFPSPFRGERGCLTKRGLISYRAIAAVYQTHRLKQELAPINGRSVIEIGPGMGRTAYYAWKAGLEYTTVDLPLGVVAQACFLQATLGPDAIWLPGDTISDVGRIRLLSGDCLKRLDARFDVALNVDSLTEMGQPEINAYARWIAAHAGLFLSINMEANVPRVPDTVRNHFQNAHFRRFPYWMRPGYAEEIVTQYAANSKMETNKNTQNTINKFLKRVSFKSVRQ